MATLVTSHIVGSEHAYQGWNNLEDKSGVLSRSQIHDLNRSLFSLKKATSMELYLDYIKEIGQKIASGAQLEDEDLVFCTLNGLSIEYGSFIICPLNGLTLVSSSCIIRV